MSLCLVLLNSLTEEIAEIRSEIQSPDPELQTWCNTFIIYLENTWINGSHPPMLWNFFNQDDHSTNNVAVG